ncbi:MAG: hypothetical protein R3F11_11270 [Verrucomicrobiales bacterium]
MMKLIGCAFLAVSFLLVYSVWDDYQTGSTTLRSAPIGNPDYPAMHTPVERAADPEEFERFLVHNGIAALITFAIGVAILGICRHQDRLDPTSPNFCGDRSFDE